MIHHECHIVLIKIIERRSLWKYVPDILMVTLTAALLVSLLRIAVEHFAFKLSGRLIHLDRTRIGKFSTTVSEYQLEESGKIIAQSIPQKYVCRSDIGRSLVISDDHELDITVAEEDGEYDFTAFSALDSVHFSDWDIRMLLDVGEEVRKCSSYMALFVNVKFRTAFLTGRFPAYFTAKINIADAEHAFIDVIIQSSFGYRHTVVVFAVCDRNRYAAFDQRDDSLFDI